MDYSISDKNDAKAFLFSLINSYNYPIKLTITNPGSAIVYGFKPNQIAFGSGVDLLINIDGSYINGPWGSSNLGFTYRVPSFLSIDPIEINSFFGGTQTYHETYPPTFEITEIEVYTLDSKSH